MLDAALVKELLRSQEPSVRWKVRVHVLGEDRDSRRIRALEEEIRRSPRVRALLSRRDRLGAPGTARSVYYKWQGLHWVLASLADIGYPRGDASLRPIRDRLIEFWLTSHYYREFTANTEAATYRGHGVPLVRGRYRRCASQQGNALYSIATLGLGDGREEGFVERLLHWQWPDGGWNCDRKPEAHVSSFTETWLPMVGLAAFGSAPAREAARRASEVFLSRRLFRRISNGRIIHPDVVRLHYPLYWHYDILGGLKAMVRVGSIGDPRCAEALDLLESKRLSDGGWPTEARYYKGSRKTFASGSDWVDWGGTSARRRNAWVTADALAVLQAAGRTAL